MEKQEFILKQSGDKLKASEWNNLTSYVNSTVDEISRIGLMVDSYIDDESSNQNPKSDIKLSVKIPRAFYIVLRSSSTYVDINGRVKDNLIIEPATASAMRPSPTSETYEKYVVSENIGAGSVGPGGTCTYIYSTDLEKFFNINISGRTGVISSMDLAMKSFLEGIFVNGYGEFRYDSTDYLIIASDDIVDDIVMISPMFAGEIGVLSEDVKLSDLITIVNLMKNQTGPWATN